MVQITMLNGMAGGDFAAALDRHVQWKLRLLDLKDGIYGRGILDLSDDQAQTAAGMLKSRELSVYCFSTGIGYADIEQGESAFRATFRGQVQRAIELAQILRPKVVRLLAARTGKRVEIADSTAYIRQNHPWLFDFYREAIDRLHAAGLQVAIENEVHGCIFSSPAEILGFFDTIGGRGKSFLTWDVQNLWQMGTFPSLQVYHQLKPLIGHVHLKGGMLEGDSCALRWRSALEDASWPVREIVGRVIADGVSPVICLNPSHGEAKPGYRYDDVVCRDLAFLRSLSPEVAQ